jgi:hypothetical protein
MALNEQEKHFLREAIYVASIDANPTLATALKQLNEMVLDDTYPYWTNKAVIDSAIARSPGYMAAWDSLLRELKDAPPVGIENPTPEPTPPEESYPHVPSDAVADEVREALRSMGVAFHPNGEIAGFKLRCQSAEGDFFAFLGVSDGALRLLSGIREKIGGQWPDVDRNPDLPMTMHAYERDRGISWDYEPPLLASDANPRPFKTFIMYLAGFAKNVGPRGKNNVGKFIDIGTFEKGRGIRFNTMPSESPTPDIMTAIRIDPDVDDAVSIRVGGALRRVVVDENGGLRVGDYVNEYE